MNATPDPARPEVSVVVPVFNEEATLGELRERVAKALGDEHYELVLVDDGSRDRSRAILRELAASHPEVVAVLLTRNYGQHPAVMAGLSISRGRFVVTLDADLQNPPEEIPRILAELRAGHDAVGTVRVGRHDPWLRRQFSSVINRVTTSSIGSGMTDYGCMLRGYSRQLVDEIVDLGEHSTFLPALATTLARSAVEIPVEHAEREEGGSRYSPLRLMRLAFDLLTGFSLLPIQLVSLTGVAISILGVGFAGFLLVRRLVVGPEVQGVFTLFAILFAFIGVLMFGVGIVGEYVARVYAEVRRRPVFRISEVVSRSRPDERP
jgi:undecaprenyl-phosphate 4-deoxy-4-formamido-L-arabinose transferase